MTKMDINEKFRCEKANAVVQEAKDQIGSLLSSARGEVQERINEAKAEGFKKGQEKAEEFGEKLDKLEAAVLSEATKRVPAISFEIASKILKLEFQKNPKLVLPIVLQAVSDIPESGQIWLRAHPQDVDFLLQNKKKILSELDRLKELDIRADKQVERGGILIQTDLGVIDAQISTQIEEMARVVGG